MAQRIQAEVGIDEMHHELLPEQKLAHVEKMMQEHTFTVIGALLHNLGAFIILLNSGLVVRDGH